MPVTPKRKGEDKPENIQDSKNKNKFFIGFFDNESRKGKNKSYKQ